MLQKFAPNAPKHVDLASLETLADKLLGIQLDKFFQVSDWRIRPLPQGMIDYARSDSRFLIPLYGVFQMILTGNINNVWLKEDLLNEEWVKHLKQQAFEKNKASTLSNGLDTLAKSTN